jgi:hypothetical protein
MKLIFKGPINSTSLGNVSVNILKELFALDFEVSLFPTQDLIDTSVFETDKSFQDWLEQSYENRFISCEKNTPTLQVWHIKNSGERLSDKSFLYTFHETDSVTLSEKKICETHDKVFFSSSFSNKNFTASGASNTKFIPLGFDKSFSTLKNPSKLEGQTHFSLMGKMEKRKHTLEIIKNWVKIFGNDPAYQLSCLITNKFIPNNIINQSIASALNGEFYENVNFLPFLNTNKEVNEFINSVDIDLTGLSGGEGWNLPAFNSAAIGKTCCVLNATSHADWATEENSVLVQPKHKVKSHDGVFFIEGAEFNQGNFFGFTEDCFQKSVIKSLARHKQGNESGKQLQTEFTYKKTVDKILSEIF